MQRGYKLKEVDDFSQFYFFVQTTPMPSLFFGIVNMIYALPVSIKDWCMPYCKIIGAYDEWNHLIGLLEYDNEYKRINYLYVNRKHRKKGIAKRLIKESRCDVVVSAKKAKEFWRKKGFNREIGNGYMIKEIRK